MAGVSAGTVDRVLHNRGDVSESSKEKVRKVLDAIDYHPNMFAIGLAAKKKYTFIALIPYHQENDYWHSVFQGIERATIEYRPFNITVSFIYYRHGDENSYWSACKEVIGASADAVLIAPNFYEQTISLTNHLDENKVPYVFVDYNIEGAHALKYIGQDSRMSGFIAAKLLMSNYESGQEVVLFLDNGKENPAEIQMRRRLEGFMSYIQRYFKEIPVHEIILDKSDPYNDKDIIDTLFNNHPEIELGVVFNSRVYQVGRFFENSSRKLSALLGYDLLPDNITLLRKGTVKYLIGQRPGLQGYDGIKALCDHTVFKRPVEEVRYMPIDILIQENIDFYFEFE